MAEVFLKVCDPCSKRDKRQVEATSTLRLAIDDEAVRIDVCDEHAVEFGRILSTLKAVGWQDEQLAVVRAPSTSRAAAKSSAELVRSPDARGCPVCFRLFSSMGNMRSHVRKQHLRKPDEWTRDQVDDATREARQRLAREIARDKADE